MRGSEQIRGGPGLPDRPSDAPISDHRRPETQNETHCDESQTERIYTIADLYGLPAVVPVAVADDILGVGSTLSKGLRAAGKYPVPLLRNRGRHHAVSLASLLDYLGLPLPTPPSAGEAPAQEGRLAGQANVHNGRGTAA